MDHSEQRLLGAKLAAASGDKLEKTLEAVRSESSCFEDIIKSAVSEAGLDAVVPLLLQGPPEWAAQALRIIPDPGAHREALVRKAATEPEWALYALGHGPGRGSHDDILRKGAGSLAAAQGEIISVNLQNNGRFVCQYTLMWVGSRGWEPQATYPNPSQWRWSSPLVVGQGQPTSVLSFSLPNAPLIDGTVVYMYISIQAGSGQVIGPAFSYNSRAQQGAGWVGSGTVKAPNFSFTGLYNN